MIRILKYFLFFISILAFCISCSYRRDRNNDSDNTSSVPGVTSKNNNDTRNGNIRSGDNSRTTSHSSIIFKLYLESSGSMFPYDNNQGRGDFRSVVWTLLNKCNTLNPRDNIIYIVNSSVSPLANTTFNDFVRQNNIFDCSRNVGDPRFTDLERIFTTILDNTRDNQISILISDLIYSTSNMTNHSPQVIGREAEGIMNHLFNRYANNISVLILKCISDYNGPYYTFMFPAERPRRYNGNRPYYITFFGKNETMLNILKDDKYRIIRNFTDYHGFESFYIYGNLNSYIPYYSVLISDSRHHGRFYKTKNCASNSATCIHAIENIKLDNHYNDLQVPVAIDLSSVFSEDADKMNINNYIIYPENSFQIVSITPIDINRINSNDRIYLGEGNNRATHLLILKTSNLLNLGSEVKITFQKKHPDWINRSSSMDDRDINSNSFPSTTFCFANLMNGIYRAYNPDNNRANYFTITLYLKK